jgi:hypothetical protein
MSLIMNSLPFVDQKMILWNSEFYIERIGTFRISKVLATKPATSLGPSGFLSSNVSIKFDYKFC